MISSGIFQAAIAFLSNLILIRYLSPSDFGIFAIVLANASLLTSFLNLRVTDLILRSNAADVEVDLSLYYNYIVLQSIVLFLGGIVFTYLSGYLNIYAFLIIIAVSIGPFVQFKLVLFEKKMHYKKIAILESSSLLVSHLFAAIGVIIGLGPIVLYLRVLIQPIFLFVGLRNQKEPFKTKKLSFNFPDIRSIWAKSKWIYTDGMLEQGLERLMIIFASFISSTSIVGYFFQAKRLSVTPHQLLQPFTTRVLLNYFSKKGTHEKKRLLNKVLKYEVIILLLAALLIYFYGHEIIILLFGEKWSNVYPLLVNLLGVVGFLSIFNSFKAFFIACKDMRIFTLWARIPLILGLILLFSACKFMKLPYSEISILAISISGAYLIAVTSILIRYLNYNTECIINEQF